MKPEAASFETGRTYEIDYRCRDIGSGVETGGGMFVYRGITWGKFAFEPTGGGPAVYLFPDEIVDWSK